MKPRDYQLKAVEDTKKAFQQGYKNIALNLCGGSGKSLIAKLILDMAAKKGSKIGVFSYRKILVNQIKKYNIPDCDVGTLQKFGKEPTKLYDLVIVDESWGESSKLKNNINARYMITLSGTPITPDGFALSNYDYIVDGIQFPDLIEQGYAKPIKVLSHSNIDTSNLKTQAGDYSIKESFQLMNKSQIHKDIIGTYKKYATGKKVMAFCVNTDHAEQLKNEFLNNGIIADTIHSKKSDGDILKRFDNGEIKVLISVSKLNVGYDNPSVNCIMLCRPTKSIPVLLQTVWRGTRINPLKPNDECLILDLANCIQDTIHPLQKLDLSKKKTEKFTKCKCTNKMKLTNRFTEVINQYEYKVCSDYVCDCGETLRIENIKLINLSLCDCCGQIFTPKGGLQMTTSEKNLKFELECSECGAKRNFRTLIYTDDELKEISLHQAMQNGATWEDVSVILKKECKDANYKWQYANRLIDRCKNVNYTPKQVIEFIKTIKKQNKRISQLMYI